MNIQDYYKYSQLSALAYVDWEVSVLQGNYDVAIANAAAAERVPGDTGDAAINTLVEPFGVGPS